MSQPSRETHLDDGCCRTGAEAKAALKAAHRLLDALGVASAIGQPCDDEECNYLITHRIKLLAAREKPKS